MKCDERTKLLCAYNQAALSISTTIADLLHGPKPTARLIYDIRRHAAEQARIHFELAEQAYEAHIHTHDCVAMIGIAPQPVICAAAGN